MANYRVKIELDESGKNAETLKENEKMNKIVPLTNTNLTAVIHLCDHVIAGDSISTVVTAINNL